MSTSPLLNPTWYLNDAPRSAPELRTRTRSREPPEPSRLGKEGHPPQPSADRKHGNWFLRDWKRRPRFSLRAAPPLPQCQPRGRAAQALDRRGEDWRMGRLAPRLLFLCLFWGAWERLPGAEAVRKRGPTVTAKVTIALKRGARVQEG